MKKRILAVAGLAAILFTGCTRKPQDENLVQFHLPTGLPTLSVLKQMRENTSALHNYRTVYELENTAATLSTAVMKGTPDVAIVPSTLAASVYNKNNNYQILGTVGFGSIYLASTDDSVSTIEGFANKPICFFGRNNTPEITARYVLAEKSVVIDDEKSSYFETVGDIVAQISTGKCQYSLLVEPVLSNLINNQVKHYINLNELYKTVDNEYGFPQSTLIARTEFIEKNDVYVNALIKSMKLNTDWLKSSPEEVKEYLGVVSKSYNLGITEAKVLSVITRANLNFVAADSTVGIYNTYYARLMQVNGSIIGGSVPSESIYYKVPKTLW